MQTPWRWKDQLFIFHKSVFLVSAERGSVDLPLQQPVHTDNIRALSENFTRAVRVHIEKDFICFHSSTPRKFSCFLWQISFNKLQLIICYCLFVCRHSFIQINIRFFFYPNTRWCVQQMEPRVWHWRTVQKSKSDDWKLLFL